MTDMKLLLIFPSNARGGVEEYGLKIASAARDKGWEVHAAFPAAEKTESLIVDFISLGAVYHQMDVLGHGPERQSLKDAVGRFYQIISLLYKVKPDAVQVNIPWVTKGLSSILACGFANVPAQVIFHLAPEKGSIRKALRTLGRWAQKRRQDWVAVSKHNKDIIAETYETSNESIQVVYNGIKLPNSSDLVAEGKGARTKILNEFGLPEDCQLVITVGRLDRQKGYHDLVGVADRIKKEYPQVQFLWAGEGELRTELIAEINQLGLEGTITLLGHRNDVPDLLKAADLFVFPSYFEGFPFALLEAMAHMVPVVVSESCGMSELIVDKCHGLLCRAGDQDSIMTSVAWALDNPKNMSEMAANAYEKAQEFSEENMLETALIRIEGLAGGGMLGCQRAKV